MVPQFPKVKVIGCTVTFQELLLALYMPNYLLHSTVCSPLLPLKTSWVDQIYHLIHQALDHMLQNIVVKNIL